MVHGEFWTVKELFVYPNEYIYWSVQIVMYPFMTGLVAGAFVLSSLYHVFGIKQLREMARFALVFSFALLFVAPMPIVLHLQHPLRGINVFMTPHFTSAIAAFGIVFSTYGAIVASELWFLYRKHFVEIALPLKEKQDKSLMEWLKFFVFCSLTLGVYDISEETLKKDEKAIRVLAAIGIPVACFLHGYAGFIFGSVKANALWMTPLMPVIFIMSAIVSGIALCMLTYIVTMEFRKWLSTRRQTATQRFQARQEIAGVEVSVIRMTAKYLSDVPCACDHTGTSGPHLQGIHRGKILGRAQERHLREGLHRHLHPSVRCRQPASLRPVPAAGAYHQEGCFRCALCALRSIHDEVECRHRGSGLFSFLCRIYALPPPDHPARLGDLQRRPWGSAPDRSDALSPVLGDQQDIPCLRCKGSPLARLMQILLFSLRARCLQGDYLTERG